MKVIFFLLLIYIIYDIFHNRNDYLAFFSASEPQEITPNTSTTDGYIRNIVRQELANSQPKMQKVMSSCKAGFIRGCLAGLITGGAEGAITNGVVNATLNPMMLAFNK